MSFSCSALLSSVFRLPARADGLHPLQHEAPQGGVVRARLCTAASAVHTQESLSRCCRLHRILHRQSNVLYSPRDCPGSFRADSSRTSVSTRHGLFARLEKYSSGVFVRSAHCPGCSVRSPPCFSSAGPRLPRAQVPVRGRGPLVAVAPQDGRDQGPGPGGPGRRMCFEDSSSVPSMVFQ